MIRKLATFALAVLAVCTTLAGSEALLRARPQLIGNLADNTLDRYRPHPVWHHWLRPHQKTAIPSFNPAYWPAPIVYQTNSFGCRYRELELDPPPGTYRILVMGDSFTEGYYIEDTFAAVLERRLNDLHDGVRYEVVGCGNSSYSPLLHYLRYRDQLSKLHPREIVVNVDLTDIYDDNWRYGPTTEFSTDGEPLRAGSTTWSRRGIADALRFRFYVARLVLGMPGNPLIAPVSENVFAYYRGMSPDDPRFRQEAGRTMGYLKRLTDLAKSQQTLVTVTTYPYQFQLRAGVHGEQQWNRNLEFALEHFARQEGVRFWSAYDALLPHADTIYWSNDIHFTPVGQRVWAEAFARYYTGRVDKP